MSMPAYDPSMATGRRSKRRNGAATAAVIVAVVVLALCAFGSCLAFAVNGSDGPEVSTPGSTVTKASGSGPGAGAQAARDDATGRKPLKPADVKLGVKITEKNCFGSAGCNVHYEITAAWPFTTMTPGECDVTYAMRGLEDEAVGTLRLRSDGTFSQDSFQYGQTPRSSTKVAAKVTEVSC